MNSDTQPCTNGQAATAVHGPVHPLVVPTVAVLFVRRDSVYKTLPGCDCYDEDRDARMWPGGCPVVAHPPCRTWGALRHLVPKRPEEHALGPFGVEQVRRWGGVPEHPARSALWSECSMARPGKGRDAQGGWTMDVDQHWWGHDAQKRTWLYICGCDPRHIPEWSIRIDEAIFGMHGPTWNGPIRKPEMKKGDRDKTPPAFAAWLVALARRCAGHNT